MVQKFVCRSRKLFYINLRGQRSRQSMCLKWFLIFSLFTHHSFAEQTLFKLINVTKKGERNQPLFSSQQMIQIKVSLMWSLIFFVNNATVPGLQGLLLNYACHILPVTLQICLLLPEFRGWKATRKPQQIDISPLLKLQTHKRTRVIWTTSALWFKPF